MKFRAGGMAVASLVHRLATRIFPDFGTFTLHFSESVKNVC